MSIYSNNTESVDVWYVFVKTEYVENDRRVVSWDRIR
jgi:hypothetical protein